VKRKTAATAAALIEAPADPTPKPEAALPAPTATPLRQTILWLLEGNSTDDVAEAIAAAYPDTDPKTLLTAAGDHFAAVAHSDPAVIRGWALDALRELYRRMMAIGDFSGALRAVERLLIHSKRLGA
jgi:hypothetical protein